MLHYKNKNVGVVALFPAGIDSNKIKILIDRVAFFSLVTLVSLSADCVSIIDICNLTEPLLGVCLFFWRY